MTVALLAALGGGWLWGAADRQESERALRAAQLQNDLLEASAAVLAAHVSLYDADPLSVARHLEDARGFVGRAGDRLRQRGVDATREPNLAGFCAGIDNAQRLVQGLDTRVPRTVSSQ